MLAVLKYTSNEFHRSHITVPKSHFPPESSTEALKVMAHIATRRSAAARLTT